MADTHIPIEPSLTPLLIPTPQRQDQRRQEDLDRVLRRLEVFLLLLGFNQSSVLSFSLSWLAFVLVGVLLPVTIFEVSKCAGCAKYQIKKFELDIVASQACLAAAALFCISYNLRKYGIRKFLFVDKSCGQHAHFTHQYIQQIKVGH
uniref:Uncharacterized protein MANES_13G016400 n=1 Tax=Rhizophora mucronata TaxID=61149 RepID=A0A2P2JE54_RHIMU